MVKSLAKLVGVSVGMLGLVFTVHWLILVLPAKLEAANAADLPPGLPVSAYEISSLYNLNEISAQQKYGKVALEVTGTASELTVGYDGNPIVVLDGSNSESKVRAYFKDEEAPSLSDHERGDPLRMRCEQFEKGPFGPTLSECVLLAM